MAQGRQSPSDYQAENPHPPKERLRTVAQAARLCGLSESQIWTRIAKGQLRRFVVPRPPKPPTILGRRVSMFVDVEDLEAIRKVIGHKVEVKP